MTKLLPLLLLAACGDDAATPPDAAADATETSRMFLGGVVHDLDPAKPITELDQPALDGVEVCLIVAGEDKRCITTVADGTWMFDVPKLRKGVAFTLRRSGYAPLYNVMTTLDEDEGPLVHYLPRDADVSAFMQHFQATYPLTDALGAVMLQGIRHVAPDYIVAEGVTMSSSIGEGPFYMASAWGFGTNQLATTAAGFGYGVFGDIDSNATSADVTVTLAGTSCAASRESVPLVADNTVRVPIVPGFFTHLPVVCE